MKLDLSKYPNLKLRVFTAMIGAAIILTGCSVNHWTYFVVFLFICTLTTIEFYNLTWMDGMLPLKFMGTLNVILLFTLTFLIEAGLIGPHYYFILFPCQAMIFLIKLYKKEDKPFTNIAYTFLGIFYVGLPFSLLNFAVFSSGHYSAHIIIGIMLMLWAGDIGGYFIGIRFGKRKLFERVSPKKSWEGMIGAFIFVILTATVISFYFDELNFIHWNIFGVIMVVTGTYGDLVESLFKRSISIKDSGNTLPGHGGFLDRFDGLLISIFFIVFYLKVIIY
jgi:phosphatidate cytidylyltransferase